MSQHPPSRSAAAWQERLRVVLVRPRNPLNIGAAARAMSNFGFRQLRLVSVWEPSLLNARSAVGASDLLHSAGRFDSVAEAVADCSLVVGTTAIGSRELQHPLQFLRPAAEAMRAALDAAPAALLFGSEKTGLSNHELSYCHRLLHIPTVGGHISMNLGQAVAVCLCELASCEPPAVAAGPEPPVASSEQSERLAQLLFDSLRQSGYVKPRTEDATLEKLRRMVRRMRLGQEDAEVWLGMLRHLLWKLTHPGDRH